MSGTRPESDANLTAVTSLADAIRTDEPEDSRSCPHETCHGSLAVDDDDRVYCTSCRTTPDGVYLPDDYDEQTESTETEELTKSPWRDNVLYGGNPKGPRVEITHASGWSHDTYGNSHRVRLAGGYEPVYDDDEENRPRGVGDEYTFDLSTL